MPAIPTTGAPAGSGAARLAGRAAGRLAPVSPSAALGAIGLLACSILVYAPIGVLVWGVLDRILDSPAFRREIFSLAIPTLGPGPTLIGRSLFIAAASALGASSIGWLAALETRGWRSGWKGRLRWMPVALVAVPAYVHALAWSTLLHGLAQRLPPPLRPTLLGAPVAAWVQAMTLLPMAYSVSLVALELVPERLQEAGRMLQDERRVLRGIVFPLAFPVLAAGFAFGFLTSLLDYSIPALYQTSVLSLGIFADYSATMDATRATVLSAPIFLCGGVAAWWMQRGGRSAALAPRRPGGPPSSAPARIGGILGAGTRLAALGLAAQVLFTILGLLRSVGDPGRFIATLAPAGDDLAFSLAVALGAGLLCILPALALAAKMSSRRPALWWLLAALPLAVPGPLVGIGLIRFWNSPWLSALPVYGSAWMPVLAASARFLPLAALVLAAQLWRVDPTLLDAARVHRRSGLHSLVSVEAPLVMPGLIAAFGLVFALTLGELGATVLVQPPGLQTLTVRAFNALHFGSSESVAGLCLAMAVLAYAVAAASISVFRGGLRILREGRAS